MTGDRIGRQLSLATRRELIQAIADRYHAAERSGNKQILDEFIQVTGYHRKHAIYLPAKRAHFAAHVEREFHFVECTLEISHRNPSNHPALLQTISA